jgi:CRP/FNR family transcriptional regulator, anaerobic regulatory protein
MKKVSFNQAWTGQADCLNCSIRESALFSGLTEEDFSRMHQPVDQLELQPTESLYQVSEEGAYLYTIRSGLVKLVQYRPDGSQRIVRLSGTTDVIGLEAMVRGHYEHESIALKPTELCRYPVSSVDLLGKHNPVLYRDLINRWQNTLTEAEDWITQLSTGPAKVRMAYLLIKLANVQGECDMLNREDVGSILSMTTETASRTVSEFKRNKLINEMRKNHYQVDLARLNQLVSG